MSIFENARAVIPSPALLSLNTDKISHKKLFGMTVWESCGFQAWIGTCPRASAQIDVHQLELTFY